jgi:hypothetical protein
MLPGRLECQRSQGADLDEAPDPALGLRLLAVGPMCSLGVLRTDNCSNAMATSQGVGLGHGA